MARAHRLIAFALGLLASSFAHAQTYATSPNPGLYADQGEAYAACYAFKGTTPTSQNTPQITIIEYKCLPHLTVATWARASWKQRYTNGATQAQGAEAWQWPAGATCAARGAMSDAYFPVGSPSLTAGAQCIVGCTVTIDPAVKGRAGSVNPQTGVGTLYESHARSYSGSGCSDVTPPDEDTDPNPERKCTVATGTCVNADGSVDYCTFNQNGTPSQCVPGTADDDGDGIPNTTDTHPKDPNNAKDNGSGNESDNTSTSGVDCDNPPISKGDGILAQIAYQAWKGRCATEKANSAVLSGDPNQCTGTITCTGKNPKECYDIALSRKTACAAAAAAASLAAGQNITVAVSGGGQDPNTAAIKDNTKAVADAVGDDGQTGTDPDAASTRGSIWPGEGGSGPGSGDVELDRSGWLSSRSCPAPRTVSIMGRTIDTHFDKFCDFLAIGANLVLVVAALTAGRILMKEV